MFAVVQLYLGLSWLTLQLKGKHGAVSCSDFALLSNHPETDHPDALLKQGCVRMKQGSQQCSHRPAWVLGRGGGVHDTDQGRVQAF